MRAIITGGAGYIGSSVAYSLLENGHEIATIHAEQNAVVDCAKRGASCNKCTAYITHYPCLNCTKLLLASGIKKIKYIDDYRNNENVAGFCHKMNVKIDKI